MFSPAINVRRVKKVDPRIQRGIHNAVGFLLIRQRSEIHCAKTDTADLQARLAKISVLHLSITPRNEEYWIWKTLAYIF
ncbi:hypothetical protein D3C71_1781960 [compost metagenome]